jgi:hypothetical protein
MHEIEAILGRPVREEERGTLMTLNQVSASLVSELRRLPRLMQHRLLRFYVEPSSSGHIGRFLEDVVDGDQDPSRWGLGRVLVPSFTLEELMVTNSARIVEAIGAKLGNILDRIVPSHQNWVDHGALAGAPAVVRPHLDYKWSGGPHVLDMHIENAQNVEPAGDAVVAVRRWITVRFSSKYYELLREAPTRRPSLLLGELYPGMKVTEDAQIGVGAAPAEIRRASATEAGVPGFCGPDAWYRATVDEWTG